MKNSKITVKKYTDIIKVLFAVGILLALFFTVLALALYEKDVHYFRVYSVTPKIYSVLMCIFSVTAFLMAYIAPKKELPEKDKLVNVRNKLSDLASIICAGFVFVTVISRVPAIFRHNDVSVAHPVGHPGLLNVLFVLFGLAAAAYFVSEFFGAARVFRAYLGFGVIIYLIIYLLTVYYDTNIPINSPMRVLDQITTIGMMVWFMLEERFIIETPSPYIYVSVGLIATSLCFALGLSTVLCVLFGKIDASTYAVFGALEALAFGIWIWVRVYSFVTSLLKAKT